MFCLADMLWADKDFIGNTYPQEVCEKILHSMERLSNIRPERVIEGMTPSEFSLLCCAVEYPRRNPGKAATVAEIAAQMNVLVPAVSRTLRSLQEKGWIERAVDECDRRSVRVTATPAGEEMLWANMKRVVNALNRIMSVFTEEEMRTIAELYSKFANSMEQNIGR